MTTRRAVERRQRIGSHSAKCHRESPQFLIFVYSLFLLLHNYIFRLRRLLCTRRCTQTYTSPSDLDFPHSICIQLKAGITHHVLYHTYTRISWHFRPQQMCLHCVYYNFRSRQGVRNLVHASMTLGPKGGPSLVAEGCSCASASVKAARKRNSTICQAGRR